MQLFGISSKSPVIKLDFMLDKSLLKEFEVIWHLHILSFR